MKKEHMNVIVLFLGIFHKVFIQAYSKGREIGLSKQCIVLSSKSIKSKLWFNCTDIKSFIRQKVCEVQQMHIRKTHTCMENDPCPIHTWNLLLYLHSIKICMKILQIYNMYMYRRNFCGKTSRCRYWSFCCKIHMHKRKA